MAFTETEREGIRMLCIDAARIGTDEGIRAAAEMIRKAHEANFTGSLLDLAALIESSTYSSTSVHHD